MKNSIDFNFKVLIFVLLIVAFVSAASAAAVMLTLASTFMNIYGLVLCLACGFIFSYAVKYFNENIIEH